MIRENKFDDIGGAPQLLKVYEHMNRTPIGVKWEINGNKVDTLLGRPLQGYESNNYPIMDADSFEVNGGNNYG